MEVEAVVEGEMEDCISNLEHSTRSWAGWMKKKKVEY